MRLKSVKKSPEGRGRRGGAGAAAMGQAKVL